MQFNKSFTFNDARARIGYLHALGISDLYASPYFRARAESTHGYDICDHNSLNPGIGSEADHRALIAELHRNGMSHVLDTVPNHMGIGETCNGWWMDVLENGPGSIYAPFFDIDWNPIKSELKNKVLLPTLGDQYGRILENGELQVKYDAGTFTLNYWDTVLPLDPCSYADILSINVDSLMPQLGADNPQLLELQSILTALSHLPEQTVSAPDEIAERNREKEIIKSRLARLTTAAPDVLAFIEQNLHRINGTTGESHSYDVLDGLISRQAYRLAYWRVAAEEINYRRFFDINDLAAIRMERADVFHESHRMIMRFLGDGAVNGLRIDHPDGLWNPRGYFYNLQRSYAVELARRHFPSGLSTDEAADLEAAVTLRFEALAQDDPKSVLAHPLYVVVEKILGKGEVLPSNWPVHGTTGYEFTNWINGIFVDAANEKAFDLIYTGVMGERVKFADLVYDKKKQIMALALASEINVLADKIDRISEKSRYFRDFTLYSLRSALREVIATFPVYRTYIEAETGVVEKRDQAYIETAVARAKKRNPAADPSIYDFIRDILLLRYPTAADEEARQEQRNFVMSFQQCTGPVMAKGLEDTAFYIYNRLISLNEVGGDPEQFGISVAQFHRQNAERHRNWPYSLLATATHDTKRSEDVRARINVLSEMPKEWRSALTRWTRLNKRKKSVVDSSPAPSANEEYFIYQTLVGVWPDAPMDADTHKTFIGRIQEYMVKALHEAKVNSSWLNPNEAYDTGVTDFIAKILDPAPSNKFVADLQAFHAKIVPFGRLNSLAQTLLKATVPGVPDFYQGSEMWDLSLVDPDNRRPVDYEARDTALRDLIDRGIRERGALAADLIESAADGRIKLYVANRALVFRQTNPDLFGADGTYTPLDATGDAADHIIAFSRSIKDTAVIVAVPRLMARLTAGNATGGKAWKETYLTLPGAKVGQKYRNLYTWEEHTTIEHDGGAVLPLAEVFGHFPVALLEQIPFTPVPSVVTPPNRVRNTDGKGSAIIKDEKK